MTDLATETPESLNDRLSALAATLTVENTTELIAEFDDVANTGERTLLQAALPAFRELLRGMGQQARIMDQHDAEAYRRLVYNTMVKYGDFIRSLTDADFHPELSADGVTLTVETGILEWLEGVKSRTAGDYVFRATSMPAKNAASWRDRDAYLEAKRGDEDVYLAPVQAGARIVFNRA